MTPLQRLEAWSRKYYTYEIHSGPHLGWGEEWVKLTGGGRTVCVDNAEVYETFRDRETEPGIEDVITAALDKWESDTSEKKYVVWYHLVPDDGTPPPIHERIEVVATTELEAWTVAERTVKRNIGDAPVTIKQWGCIRERA
jgi:hypothetical protein